ncbi:nicotinamidase-like [Acanthaster planci]|uniref:nicotinamidase n=1 Tax=Acanthaster planci TaxID=133434 RepID=A0A8B7Z5V5_ACAPL|nr:nicotinamidase-like [Acanthaster planci]
MAQWNGFEADYKPQSSDLRDTCFSHYDKDRDGVLNATEFHTLCCDLFIVDGRQHVFSKTESEVMMGILSSGKSGVIDKNDFDFCWKNWFKQILNPKAALIVVDVQNDFVDGSMDLRNSPAGQDGAEVLPVINRLLDLAFDVVVYTKDYHPPDHVSFFKNLNLRKLHPSSHVNTEKAKMFDTVIFDSEPLVEQTLWPAHCVEGTKGAELHPDLKFVKDSLVHLKGTDPDVESYSAFIDNKKRVNAALVADLKVRGVIDIYVCGLAFDVCVAMTSLDGQRLGYRVMVIEDASRCTSFEKVEKMKREFLQAGCVIGTSLEVPSMLSGKTRLPQWGLVAAQNALKARVAQQPGYKGETKLDEQ